MADTLLQLPLRCAKCGETKPYEQFNLRDKHRKPGKRGGWCKPCTRRNALEIRDREKAEAIVAREWARWKHVSKEAYLRAWESRKHLPKRYGLTLDQYCEMVEARQNRCDICGGTQRNGRNLSIDHCHSTGIVRGLLCDRCNIGIGYLQDSEVILESAVAYLRQGLRKRIA